MNKFCCLIFFLAACKNSTDFSSSNSTNDAPPQTFNACSGSSTIQGSVYNLQENGEKPTRIPPNYDRYHVVSTVCLSNFDIAPRDFRAGIPNVPNLTEWFAISFRGNLAIPATGRYTFKLFSDDGSKLFIDDSLFIDNDGIHAAAVTQSIDLAEGLHPYRLEYFQGTPYRIALQLFWRTPYALDTKMVTVPPHIFRN